METIRAIQRIKQTRIWFFEKINKIDKPLARHTRGHRESILIFILLKFEAGLGLCSHVHLLWLLS